MSMEQTLKRTLVILLTALPLYFTPVWASNDGPDDIPLTPIHNDNIRPRSIAPVCYYLDGYVYIICDTCITSTSATVTRQSDNVQWNNISYSNILQISVSTDPGIYHISLVLSDGSLYYGDYNL